MIRKLTLAAMCLMVASPLMAAPLDKSQIPADAQWFIAVDVEGLVASKVGTAVIEEANKQGLDIMMDAAKGAIGFNPLKDLKTVTLYGTKFGADSGVIILEGKFDKDKIIRVLQLNKSFKQDKIGDHTIYEWLDTLKGGQFGVSVSHAGGQPTTDSKQPADMKRFGAFHGDNKAVVATSDTLLKAALELLDGKGESIAKKDDKGIPSGKDAFVAAYVTNLEAADAKPEAAFLKKIAGGWFVMGEKDDAVFARLAVTARDEATGKDLGQVADGFVALLRLVQPPDGQKAVQTAKAGIEGLASPEFVAIIKSIKVARQDLTVTVEASTPVKTVVELMKAAAAKERSKKQSSPAAPVAPAAPTVVQPETRE